MRVAYSFKIASFLKLVQCVSSNRKSDLVSILTRSKDARALLERYFRSRSMTDL
jgi:hypothetical protein